MNKKNNNLEDNNNTYSLANFAEDNCILRVVSGSNAYGTNLPTSDWDERGIFINKIEDVVLNFNRIEQVELPRDDIVLFELTKYMTLLAEQNPNILEILWTEPEDILHQTSAGVLLLEHRADFLTSNVYNTYVNYALSQLKRIKGHNQWINKPQNEESPKECEFISVVLNTTDNKEMNKIAPLKDHCAISLGNNIFGLWSIKKINFQGANWINTDGCIVCVDKSQRTKFLEKNNTPDLIVKYNLELYKSSHTIWKNYWTWKKNRNDIRSSLEIKHGYDTKHAMHLIRLLRSGKDILEKGIVPVKRIDAEYLLSIRSGNYTYEEILKESEKLISEIEILYKKTKLPSHCDIKLIKDITMKIYSEHWGIIYKPKINDSYSESPRPEGRGFRIKQI